MPVISRFFGIIIYMYWRDHAPPHFHAKYAGEEVEIEIESGKVLGSMNKRALKMIQEWRESNKADLLEDWKLAEEHKELKEIKPLE
ncbi:MAG TPA: transcriptional regulator [Lentisphaeria bacterium]|nr:MAG: transcriptional regulator [Lentisphaerae bacterium GWF2_50_93]HCE45776.1 transcriptional regulator [Lentisphaeria bacterium]